MRVSREKCAENRERVLLAAGALFQEKGFDGVAVAEIMKAVGLTHGGFYGHFESKDDLEAQASRAGFARSTKKWRDIAARAPDRPFSALVRHYLSERHRDDPADGCALPCLAGEASRQSPAVRSAFSEGVSALIEVLTMAAPEPSLAQRRRAAIFAMAEMVGAVLLARSIDDADLSVEILETAKRGLASIDKPEPDRQLCAASKRRRGGDHDRSGVTAISGEPPKSAAKSKTKRPVSAS
jgi:TetR/AcrR family transcriptional regulator, transcriptional repressor for nem operon